MYYIGGFGGLHYIGWIDVETYYNAEPMQQMQQEQGQEKIGFQAQGRMQEAIAAAGEERETGSR